MYRHHSLHLVPQREERWLSRLLHRAFYDTHSRWFRPLNNLLAAVTIVSVAAFALETVPSLEAYRPFFFALEFVAVVIFTFEYLARIVARRDNIRSYVFSFFGLVDLLAILPTYLGLTNLAFLKTARVLRILRLLRLVHIAELPLERYRMLDDHAPIYSLSVQIYLFALVSAVTIFGTLIYVAEGSRTEFASVPLGMLWAAKVTMGGVAQHMPATVWGDFVVVATRFTGLALFGLMLSIIGTSVRTLLLGSKPR